MADSLAHAESCTYLVVRNQSTKPHP